MASFPGMVIFSLVLFESLGLRVTSDKLLKMEGEKGSSENKSLPHGTQLSVMLTGLDHLFTHAEDTAHWLVKSPCHLQLSTC